MSTPVTIIIPAFNQLDYCRQCIESIRANTSYPYRLILVDNGSTDGVGEYFDSIPDAVVLHAGRNLGFAAGVNLGLAHAQGHVLLLNSDTLVPKRWLERLVEALESAPDIGMVGPLSNCVSGSQQIDGLSFTTMEQIHTFADDLAQRNATKLRDVARLVGFCLLIREEAFKAVGTFDESYGIGNFEDDDYCLRILRAGYRLCVAEGAFVFHYGSRTFAGMGITGETWKTLIDENERRFFSKWDVRPEERSDALQAARQLKKQPETPNAVTVREYQPEDEPEWMRVHAIILSISHAWNYTIQERPQYEGHQSTRLVAIVDGRIAGLTDAQYENAPGEFCFLKDSPGGYVLEFGRLPEYTGHNLGKRLIDATVEDAARKGFHRLEYWSMDRKAQRFYQRIGLHEIGRHYRFRMKAPADIADGLLKQSIGVEYLYCACTVENWPEIRRQHDIIKRHPLEPHLCIGYEIRF